MKIIKFFCFSIGVLLLESLVLAIMLMLLSFFLKDSVSNNNVLEALVGGIFLLFMYKAFFELLIIVYSLYCSKKLKDKFTVKLSDRAIMKSKLNLRDMVFARLYGTAIALVALILGALDNPEVFLRVGILFIPSIIISYFLAKPLWKEFLHWVN